MQLLLAASLLYSLSTDPPHPELRVEDYVKLTDKRERGERAGRHAGRTGSSDVLVPTPTFRRTGMRCDA
jgi:hypothetical protein